MTGNFGVAEMLTTVGGRIDATRNGPQACTKPLFCRPEAHSLGGSMTNDLSPERTWLPGTLAAVDVDRASRLPPRISLLLILGVSVDLWALTVWGMLQVL